MKIFRLNALANIRQTVRNTAILPWYSRGIRAFSYPSSYHRSITAAIHSHTTVKPPGKPQQYPITARVQNSVSDLPEEFLDDEMSLGTVTQFLHQVENIKHCIVRTE